MLDRSPDALPVRQAVQTRFSVLLNEGPARDAALRGLLAEAGPNAHVIRVGNPLRAPLTIERILIQTGLVEAGLLTDEEVDQAVQQLLWREDGNPTTLVIEQAETLSPAALQTLARIVPSPGSWSPGQAAPLHIVFVGEPAFAGLALATPDAGPIRDALPHVPGLPATAPVMEALPKPDDSALAIPQPPAPLLAPAVPQEPASWFEVVSTGTEAAPLVEQAPAPIPSPARPQAWQVFWTLLLFFLIGVGTVLGVAILLQR